MASGNVIFGSWVTIGRLLRKDWVMDDHWSWMTMSIGSWICAQAWDKLCQLQDASFLVHEWPLDGLFPKVVHPKPNKGGLEAKTSIFIDRI